jgi:hypothetical protein
MEPTLTPMVAVRTLFVSALLLCLGGPAAQLTASGPMTLIYVGAEDCLPCKTWQLSDGELFRRSPQYDHLVYREVRSPALFDLLNDDHWPEDLRGLRSELGPGIGVPLWIVTRDRHVILRAYGLTEWKTKVLPTLR